MSSKNIIEEGSFDCSSAANEWLEWFDQFKDERGEWVRDHRLLQGLRAVFGNEKKETETDSASSGDEEIEEEKVTEEEYWPKNVFLEKFKDFTDAAKDYLMSRRSTYIDRNRPYRPSQPNYWFYDEFREYLEKQNFIDNMVNVLVKMFAMDPELPTKPLEFIRENFGISKKEEDGLLAEWITVTNEMTNLQEESKLLEERIKMHEEKEPIEEEESFSDKSQMPPTSEMSRRIIERQKEDMKGDEKPVIDDGSTVGEEMSPFFWEDSESSSSPSELMIESSDSTLRVESEVSHLEDEIDDVNVECRVASTTESSSDLKKAEESSSSLDLGSSSLKN